MKLKVLTIVWLVCFLPFFAFAQNEETGRDLRSRNCQIADSLFEVYQQKRKPKPQVVSHIKTDTTFKTKKEVKQIVQQYVYDTKVATAKSDLQDSEEEADIT